MNQYFPGYPNYMLPSYRNAYYPYYYPEPYDRQDPATNSTYKQEVTQWLSNLDMKDLCSLFQIEGQHKTFPILKMYIFDKLCVPSQYALRQQTTIKLDSRIDDVFYTKTKQQLPPKTIEFYESLVILDAESFFDTIQVSEKYLENIKEFLNLIDELSDRNLFNSQPKVAQDKTEEPLWFNPHSFRTCAQWIISQFEKNVAVHYVRFKDKRKKLTSQKQATNNISTDLKEYFQKHFVNSKEKLFKYGEQLNQSLNNEENTKTENMFYQQIFTQPIIKVKNCNQNEHIIQFVHACQHNVDVLDSMVTTKLCDLIEQKTYLLKSFIQIVLKYYQEFLEQELIDSETKEKCKQRSEKKKHKKRKAHKNYKKELDQNELSKRLTSYTLKEDSCHLRFHRSYSMNQFDFITPPNTPSELEFFYEEQVPRCIEIEMKEIVSNSMQQSNNCDYFVVRFNDDTEEAEIDELVGFAQEIKDEILTQVQHNHIDSQQKLVQDNQQKSIRQHNDRISLNTQSAATTKVSSTHKISVEEDIVIKSPSSEMARSTNSQGENHSLTIKSHGTYTTAPTSEEEQIKVHTFNKNSNKRQQNRNDVKNNRFDKNKDIPLSQRERKAVQPKKAIKEQIKVERSNLQSLAMDKPQDIELRVIKSTIIPIIEEKLENKLFLNQVDTDSNTSDCTQSLESKIAPTVQLHKTQSVQVSMIEPNEMQPNSKSIDQSILEQSRQFMQERIDTDISSFTDQILADYDNMLPFRMLVFDRIRFVVKSLFYGSPVDIKLFGSCATGLALQDSDIDVSVAGFEQFNKYQLRSPFDLLYQGLNSKRWVVKVKPIFDSYIPVIKLEVDPAIALGEFDDPTFLNLSKPQYDQWIQTQKKCKTPIKIDVTFNTHGQHKSDHLGEATTEMVKTWLQDYPELQQLVLILKTIVKKAGISEAFKGGLSSYSIIIMVYSYLREERIKNKNLGAIFLDMIKFYGTEFDPKETGIGLFQQDGQRMFFSTKELSLPELPVLIFSPLNERLLTNSCIHAKKIFTIFSQIYKESEQLIDYYCEFVQMGKKKRMREQKLHQNFMKQQIDKLTI